MSYVDDLRENEYVREKVLENGISSFNFTNKAFWKGIWDDQTIHARGLFVKDGEVYARSYDKFFAVDERPETKLNTLVETLEYPVYCYRKENGFLGILSCHKGQPFFATKSTNMGEFAENFKRIFYENVEEDKREYLFNILETENCSAVFEVIDPINDPHIVEYNWNPYIVLLDLIKNDFTYQHLDYSYMKEIAVACSIDYKSLKGIILDKEDFNLWYNKALEEKYIEGYVCEDSKGFMFKIKNNWYKYWKRMRSVVQAIASERLSIEDIEKRYRLNENDKDLFDFMLDYVPEYIDKNLRVPDIITVRKKFLNKN